jgi:hypothetical protein
MVSIQGSRLVCEHAAVRPAPPPSTLQSTQVGQVLEWKDGDRWRTVVCVQDAQLNAEHLQKIKVVLPGASSVAQQPACIKLRHLPHTSSP